MKDESGPDFANGVLKLNFGDLKVYGRSKELGILLDAYRNISDIKIETAKSKLVMVEGYSGTGKSTLVQTLKKELPGGYFCSGKFQQLRGTDPFSALASAFNNLCESIIVSEQKKEIARRIRSTMSVTEINSLNKVVSASRQLLERAGNEGDGGKPSKLESEEGGEAGVGKTESLNQLKLAFRAFVRSVSSPSQPLVVFLDDLQWADVGSLDLFKFMVTDSTLTHVLFVGAFRNNEVTSAIHPLSLFLRDVDKEGVVRIKLESLSEGTVNELISDLTRVDMEAAAPLTQVIYQKTQGNVFFVIQFLGHLQQENLLYYSLSTYKWTWDTDRIQSETNVSNNVVDLVASKIERLDRNVQSVMKVASCLWSTFEARLLSSLFLKLEQTSPILTKSKDVAVFKTLETAVLEGMLEDLGKGRYKFSHDRIQQAAYSLIPKGKVRELLHLQIGEQLQDIMNNEDIKERNGANSYERMIFVVADQLNRGSLHISDPTKRVELARLDLLAGKSAIEMSAYIPACEYLKSGIALLNEETRWEAEYDLSLNLMSILAEVSHVIGDFEQNEKLTKEVLHHARRIEDKSRVQISYLKSLAAQQLLEEAMEFGHSILTELGQRLPTRFSIFRIAVGYVKAKRMLKGLTDENILALPLMTDHNMITANSVLLILARTAFTLQRSNELLIMTLRLVRLTVHRGLNRNSPEAFVGYGMMQFSVGNLREGYRFGQVAMKVADKLHAKKSTPMILSASCFFLDHWVLPLQDCLKSALLGHKIGMEVGDIKYAMDSASAYVVLYFASGLPLGPWESDTKSFCRQMQDYNFDDSYYALVPWWQCGLNLMGRSEDPTTLTGDAIRQDEFLETVECHGNKLAEQTALLVRAQLAYYFDDMPLAVEMIETLGKSIGSTLGHVFYFSYLFFRGLISIDMYRRAKKRMSKIRATRAIKSLRKLASRGGINCVHKVILLESEFAANVSIESTENIQNAFDKSIATASRSGFLQDAALANERAGLFFLRAGRSLDDEFRASTYISRAHELYTEWGALGKVEHLKSRMRSSAVSSNPKIGSTRCKGVSRFDVTSDAKSKRLSVMF